MLALPSASARKEGGGPPRRPRDRRLVVISQIDHLEALLRSRGLVSTQGDETLFGCASINITVQNPTLLTVPGEIGFKLEMYVYIATKFSKTVVPTWVAIGRGAQKAPETGPVVMNVSTLWQNSSSTSSAVRQNFVFRVLFSDAWAYPTQGFNDTVHSTGNLTLGTTLADAIPYINPSFYGQPWKHYVVVGTAAFPSGAVRGQLQYFLSGQPKICGIS